MRCKAKQLRSVCHCARTYEDDHPNARVRRARDGENKIVVARHTRLVAIGPMADRESMPSRSTQLHACSSSLADHISFILHLFPPLPLLHRRPQRSLPLLDHGAHLLIQLPHTRILQALLPLLFSTIPRHIPSREGMCGRYTRAAHGIAASCIGGCA